MPSVPRVLFYIEPATFRYDPLLLLPWIRIVDAALAASAGRLEAHLAASPALAAAATADFASRSEISEAPIREAFGQDRVAYMRDLCLGTGEGNPALLEALTAIRARVQPDLVVTWSENRPLRRAFDGVAILHAELGPMPRIGFALTAHLDPFGHQIGSAFDRLAKPRWDCAPYQALIDNWHDHFRRSTDALGQSRGLSDWLQTLPTCKRRIVMALQPPDWLTYEGIGPALDPLALLRRTAAEAGPDDLLIPQWHFAQAVPDEAMLAQLERDHPNIAVPPLSLRIGCTEPLLPFVDGLITISSNVALAASILGKDLTLLGRCKFSALATPPGTTPAARPDLIPFLIGRYCRPLPDWTTRPDGFADHLLAVADDPKALLAPPDPAIALPPFLS